MQSVRVRAVSALAVTLTALGVFVSLPTPAPATTVADARREADAATEAYLAADVRARELDAQIATIQQQLADAERDAERARQDATERAVEIYQGSSTTIVTVLDTASALDSARRAEIIDRVNEASDATFDRLDVLSEQLAQRRDELSAARDEQDATLEQLASRRDDLEARLADVIAAADRASTTSTTPSAAPATGSTDASGTAPAGDRPVATAPDSPTTAAPDSAPTSEPAPPTSTPTTAPAAPPAPSGVHPHHDDPFLVCTRTRESSGNYQAYNPAGPSYYGAYQFAQSTWDGTAAHAGRTELVGVRPSSASAWDQDDMAWTLYQWQGKTPWLGRC